MALTQSGYTAITAYGDPRLASLTVDGVPILPGVLAGDVHTVMQWVAQRFNDDVDPLKAGQCWGFAPREIRGGVGLSNHASGAAIDLNSARFPQHTAHMTAAQIAACRAIVADSRIGVLRRAVIRWGGDFTAGSLDQMHFEIAPGRAGKPVAKLVKKIAKQEGITLPTVTKAGFRKLIRRALITKKGRLRKEVRDALAAEYPILKEKP